MDCQKKEWGGFIVDWDKSVYEKKAESLRLLEKIATLFRGKVKHRQDVILVMLDPYIRGGNFFEFGCGCGRLGEALLERGALHYTGIDIASSGIAEAGSRLTKFGRSRYALYCADIGKIKTLSNEQSTIYCGLGIMQYLSKDELRTMFRIIGSSRFIFEAHEFKFDLSTMAFIIYRFLRKHSYYKFVKRPVIKTLVCNPERLKFVRTNGLSFVSNL